MDERGMELNGNRVGPVMEGSTLILTCDIIGGTLLLFSLHNRKYAVIDTPLQNVTTSFCSWLVKRALWKKKSILGWPASTVSWWQDGQLIDHTYEEIIPGKSRNTMKVESLQRHHRHTEFTCSGNNNNRSQALSRAVILDLYLRPLSVELGATVANAPLFSGHNQSFTCLAFGSFPAPSVSWWIDDRFQIDTHQEVKVQFFFFQDIWLLQYDLKGSFLYENCRWQRKIGPCPRCSFTPVAKCMEANSAAKWRIPWCQTRGSRTAEHCRYTVRIPNFQRTPLWQIASGTAIAHECVCASSLSAPTQMCQCKVAIHL